MKNKRTFKVLTVITTLLVCLSAANASDISERAGTSAGAFLKLGTGAPEAQALGNAFTALSYGTQALFWNPAGIATTTTREVQISHQQWFEGVGDSAIGYLQPIGKTVIGGTLRYLRLKDLDFRDTSGVSQNYYSGDVMQDFVATVSVGRTFFSALDLGATARYINENNYDVRHINASFDLGAKLRLFNNKIMLGIMGQNLGDKDEVPTAVKGGVALNTKYFTIAGEVEDYADDKARYGVGLAIHMPEEIVQVASFDLRVGYYNRENTGYGEEGDLSEKIGLESTSKISLGFGFYSNEIFGYGVGLDYAMRPSGALGTAHQLAVRLQF